MPRVTANRIEGDRWSTVSVSGSGVQDSQDNIYAPQDQIAIDALETARLLDFLADAEATSTHRRRLSVPAAQNRMARRILDFDLTFDTAGRRNTV